MMRANFKLARSSDKGPRDRRVRLSAVAERCRSSMWEFHAYCFLPELRCNYSV